MLKFNLFSIKTNGKETRHILPKLGSNNLKFVEESLKFG